MVVLYCKDVEKDLCFPFAFNLCGDQMDKWILHYASHLTASIWFVPGTVSCEETYEEGQTS